jgi:hypothetical protein
MALLLKEGRLIMAVQALEKDEKLSLRAAAKIYSISFKTLIHRRDGRPVRRDIPANLRNLMDLEEKTII